MVAYEFYRGDEINGYHLIGILPERRKHQERVTEESIMRWVQMVLGDHVDMSNILFLKVAIGKSEVGRRDRGLKTGTRRSRKLK